MSVIPLTIFFSLLLAGTFVVLFARQHGRRQFSSPESDSLLPLADETPLTVPRATGRPARPPEAAPAACGCRSGQRPPCADCLRRRDEQDPAHF